MTINDMVNVIFIPSFPHEEENWSLNIPTYVEDVSSLDEARQFTAALSDVTITPSNNRAGQQEVYPKAPPLPPSRWVGPKTGVMLYVTPQEFIRFSQELALMAEHIWSVYDALPFSEVKEFESIQFILNQIARHFSSKELEIVNRPWYDRRLGEVVLKKIERLVPDEDKHAALPRQAALQSV